MDDPVPEVRAPTVACSPVFLAPFVFAAWTFSSLHSFAVMDGLGAAVISSVVALLVGCALCVREDSDHAIFGVTAGLWAVAGAFFAMPWLVGNIGGVVSGAWIVASDLSFCATVATDRMARELRLGKTGKLASSAVAAHGVLLAIVYAVGGPLITVLYTLFVAVHAYGLRKSFAALSHRP